MRPPPSWVPLTVFVALLSEGCASAGAPRVPVAPMGVREVQTRSFDGVNPATAMKAVIDMLQDGGFTIERTDATLGLIVGRRQSTHRPSGGENALKWTSIVFTYGLSALLPWTKTESNELEASVNVTAIDDDSVRVRIALVRRTLDKGGRLQKAEALTQGDLYRDLFELLGRSLFVGQAQ